MNIGEAVALLKSGHRVARQGWNGRDMWLIGIDQRRWVVLDVKSYSGYLPFIAMKTADNRLVPWLCSQGDLLAEDWIEVSEEDAARVLHPITPVYVLPEQERIEPPIEHIEPAPAHIEPETVAAPTGYVP